MPISAMINYSKTTTYKTMKKLHFSSIAAYCMIIAAGMLQMGCTGERALGEKQTVLPQKAISADLIESFDSVFLAVNGAGSSDLHSLMIAQNDSILYERYAIGHDAEELHICWSATKTFTATAIGFAIQEGLLDIHAPLITYLNADEIGCIDSLQAPLKALTIEHLLKMSSGLPTSDFTERIRAGKDVDVWAEVKAATFTHEPGTHWRYNNLDTYLLSLALTRTLEAKGGQIGDENGILTLEDYMRVKIFRPLGITDWYFEKDRRGINPGAWGLHLSTESLMRFGIFMLHKGEWQGKQLLNAEWWDTAATPQIYQSETPGEGDWNCGYCYQSWACHIPGSFRADGMWGQYILVVPDKQLVGVMTTLCTNRTVQLDAFWKYVYDKL